MKGSKALLVTLAMTVGLLALTIGLRGQYAHLLAEHWRRQLETVPDQRAGVLLCQAAELGDAGIPVLVEALGSQRESVARAGKRALCEQFERWQKLPGQASSPKLAILADALAKRVDRFGPTARKDATDMAARILSWPLDSRMVDRRQVIASCERVFQAATVREGVVFPGGLAAGQPLPAARADADAVRNRGPTAYDPMGLGPSLVDMSRLPGGGLPIESFPQPEAPPPPVAALLSDAREERPRRLAFPPAAVPLDPAQPSAAEREPGKAPDAHTTSDRAPMPPEPNRYRALSLTEPYERGQPNPPGSLSEVETIELMERLDGRQQSSAAEARAELTRRGFTEVQLELARRLFDPDPEVRKRLARALPSMQSVAPAPWLLQLSRDHDPEVRLVAVGLIATTGDGALWQQIERAVQEDPDPRIRRQAQQIAQRLPRH